MNISQWIIENIIPAFGGVSFVVIGLSAWLGKVWSGRILMHEKAVLENQTQESLKRLETELQLELLKKDQFHQISKPTFEAIFNKKIELYSQLLEQCVEFRKYIGENALSDIEDPTDDLVGFQTKIRDLIEINRLYVTDPLFNTYIKWHEIARPYLKNADVKAYEIYESYGDEHKVEGAIYLAQKDIYSQLIDASGKEFMCIIKQIEADIDCFRGVIDLPISKASGS